jgi:hypothetical protein
MKRARFTLIDGGKGRTRIAHDLPSSAIDLLGASQRLLADAGLVVSMKSLAADTSAARGDGLDQQRCGLEAAWMSPSVPGADRRPVSNMMLTAVLPDPLQPTEVLRRYIDLVAAFGHRELTLAWPTTLGAEQTGALQRRITEQCGEAGVERIVHLDVEQTVPRLLARSPDIKGLLAIGAEGRLLVAMAQRLVAGSRCVPAVRLDTPLPVMTMNPGDEPPGIMEYLGSLLLTLLAGGHGQTAARIWNSALALREQGVYAHGEAAALPYARSLDGLDYMEAVRQTLGSEPKRQPPVAFAAPGSRESVKPRLTSVA